MIRKINNFNSYIEKFSCLFYYIYMNLNQLKIFYEAAKLQNFTLAAQKLYLTQSAVSHAIKNLEKDLNCILIHRTPKKFKLTDEGLFLYQACEKTLFMLDNAKEEILMKNYNNQIVYNLNIGVTVEFGTSVFIKVLKPFIDQNPKIRVNLKLSNNLYPLLKEDQVDLIVDCLGYDDEALEKICFLKEEYIVVCLLK